MCSLFRRLPPFLRVVSALGLLIPVAALVTFLTQLVLPIMGGVASGQELANNHRAFAIAMNPSMLSLACAFVVTGYRTRVRQPTGGRFPLDSWQRQARAIALAATLSSAQDAAFPTTNFISLIGALVMLLAFVLLVAAG